LGDPSVVLSSVLVATNGASVLGVDRNIVGYTADNLGSLGGAFVANGDGTVAGNGAANPGAGAFYNIGTTIDGITFKPGGTVTLNFVTYSTDVGARILVKDEAGGLERNGIYQVTQFNADGTMNLVRVPDFSTSTNMLHGTQVTVVGGTSANQVYFMASQNVTSVNTAGTNPVTWQYESAAGAITLAILQVTNAAVTSITQNIDVNTNANSATAIYAANPVTFSGNVTLQNLQTGIAESQALDIESTATGTGAVFSGVISEAASEDSLHIQINNFSFGNGNVTFTGENTYKGGTEVVGGTLFVNNAPGGSGTGSGNVLVDFGATLAGTGTIAPASGSTVLISSGANLSVGLPGAVTGSQFTIGLQTGTSFTLNGTLQLDLFSNSHGLNPNSAADQLIFTKTGTPTIDITNATLQVNNINSLPPSSFVVGDKWKLIDWAGLTPNGTFTFTNVTGNYTTDFTDLPTLTGGYKWDISQLYTNGLIIVAVPEPGRLLLLVLSLMALGWRRRRRRTV
jgi:autotransporter-associated beta strand protein